MTEGIDCLYGFQQVVFRKETGINQHPQHLESPTLSCLRNERQFYVSNKSRCQEIGADKQHCYGGIVNGLLNRKAPFVAWSYGRVVPNG